LNVSIEEIFEPLAAFSDHLKGCWRDQQPAQFEESARSDWGDHWDCSGEMTILVRLG